MTGETRPEVAGQDEATTAVVGGQDTPCGLPAVGSWDAYRSDGSALAYVRGLPYCRFHDDVQRNAANRLAAAVNGDGGPYSFASPRRYVDGQSQVGLAAGW